MGVMQEGGFCPHCGTKLKYIRGLWQCQRCALLGTGASDYFRALLGCGMFLIAALAFFAVIALAWGA